MREFICTAIWLGVLLFSTVSRVSSRMIHEDMTPDEMSQTFDTTEILPEYEIVPIRYSHVNKRAVNNEVCVHLKPFGRDIKLWLEPAEGVLFSKETPIYFVTRSSYGIAFGLYTDAMKKYAPIIYKQYATYTTLALSHGINGTKRMSGMIGSEKLIIRPLPKRLIKNIPKYRRSIDGIPASEQNDHHYHIVYKNSIDNSLEPFKNSLRIKRSIQNTVYPEVLVIVDYDLYNLFKKNLFDMVLYLMAFWNGVDMMYRSLDNPKYRINIAAVLIVRDNNVLEYVSLNRVGSDKLEFNKALSDSKYWLYNKVQLIDINSYDVAVTMTSLTLCGAQGYQCRLGTLGIAYVSGTCKVDHRLRQVSKTAIIHDVGAFRGISTAAHELGHSFGANHDGEHNNSWCSTQVGNIMASSLSMTKDSAEWSKCTQAEFQKFLQNDAQCLYNHPKFRDNLVRILPGRMKDANKQCEILQGTKAYKIDATICYKLSCYSRNTKGVIVASGAAIDGTPCGVGKMCLHGKCIQESTIKYSY